MQYARWPVRTLRQSQLRRQSTKQSRLSAQRSLCHQRITAIAACSRTCIGRAALQRKSSTTASSMTCCMRTHSTTMLCSLARTKTTMRGTLFCVGRSPARTSARKQPAIDALSIATLRKFDGLDWKKDNYLALGGVTASESKLPAALERTLNTFSFKRVVLCFDNDAAGQTAARRIFTMLRQRYPERFEVKCCVPKVKDFNDQLCVKLQNGKSSPSRGTRESNLSR